MPYFGKFFGIAPTGAGTPGSGLTPEQEAMLAAISANVSVMRERQNERVPEPTPIFEVPAATDPAKAVVYVRTADFVGRALKYATVTLTLKDARLLVIGGIIRNTKQVIGRTNQNGEVALETWNTDTIVAAGLEPDYELDIPGAPNFNIRVPPGGGLASDLKYPA